MRETLFWVAVVCCAAGQLLILRSVVRVRAHVAAPGQARPRVAAELAWTLLPALVLALTLAATWRAVRADSAMRDMPAAAHAIR